MTDVKKFITPFVASQFPAFYREEGPNFIAFVEAYYEWMEQQGGVIRETRSLREYADVDETSEQFVKYFKSKYMDSIPESIMADKRLLLKHIQDLYRSKGSEKAYRLLFRILFDEEIEFYYPGEHLFKPSDADWFVPRYLEVNTPIDLQILVGYEIESSGGARAVVEGYYKKLVSGKIAHILYLSDVSGDFNFNEKLYCPALPAEMQYSEEEAPIVFGSLSAVSILNGGAGYRVGDILDVFGQGAEGKARVVSTRDENGKVTFTLRDGGYGFSEDAVVTVEPAHSNVELFVANTDNFSIGDTVLDITTVPNSFGRILEIRPASLYLDSSNTGMFNLGDTLQNANNVLVGITGANGSFAAGSNVYNVTANSYATVKTSNSTTITFSVNSTAFTVADSLVSVNTGTVATVANVTVYQTTITANAVVALFGAGATFEIGAITDKQIFAINTDEILGMMSTKMELVSDGFALDVTANGYFDNDEVVTGSANVIHMDVEYVSGLPVSNGETLSNTTLGISGLNVYYADGPVLNITGTDADMTNANLVLGVVLNSSNGSKVQVKTLFPKEVITANAMVINTVSNTTYLEVYNNVDIGYFVPGMTLTGANTGTTANVVATTRLTDWGYFPATIANTNMDTSMLEAFRVVFKEIGRITYLSRINPGAGYSADPKVTVVEPLIYDLRINDGKGGYWGYNAQISARAGIAEGVVTGVAMYDSGYGYVNDERAILQSNTNVTAVTAVSIVDLSGRGAGYWRDKKSFISDEQYIQDSDFYQNFSYEILAERMVNTYERYVKELVHPTGMKLFGRYINKNEMVNQQSEAIYIDIKQSDSFRVDTNNYKADSNIVSTDENSVFYREII